MNEALWTAVNTLIWLVGLIQLMSWGEVRSFCDLLALRIKGDGS